MESEYRKQIKSAFKSQYIQFIIIFLFIFLFLLHTTILSIYNSIHII